MKILKYIASICAATVLIGAAAVGANIAATDNGKDASAATPPECHLSFSPDLRVDSVFIYPTTIGIRPTAKLKVGTPAEFSFSNLHGEPVYERKVTATLMDGDSAFWIAFPKDVPARVAVKLTIQ
jgi:hypothetical protein